MSFDANLEFDPTELEEVFGAPLPLTNPDLLDYWFRFERHDGGSVLLTLSGYERSVAVIVRGAGGGTSSSFRVERCSAVRVLEADLKTVEIVGHTPPLRCFLALDGDDVLDLVVSG